MQMNNDKVRSPDNELPLVIFHWSLVIFFLCALSGREKKCIAGFQPAKVVLTQKELSRLRCRRDAGATFFLTTRVSVVKEVRLHPEARRYSRMTFAKWGMATSGSSISGCQTFSHSKP